MGKSPGWVVGQIPTAKQWSDVFAGKADDPANPYVYDQPTTGSTLTATFELGAYQLNPAAALAALNVVAPPDPIDGQTFEISTTQTISSLTVTPSGSPAGQVLLGGGPLILTANGGVGWRYVLSTNTWYRRF